MWRPVLERGHWKTHLWSSRICKESGKLLRLSLWQVRCYWAAAQRKASAAGSGPGLSRSSPRSPFSLQVRPLVVNANCHSASRCTYLQAFCCVGWPFTVQVLFTVEKEKKCVPAECNRLSMTVMGLASTAGAWRGCSFQPGLPWLLLGCWNSFLQESAIFTPLHEVQA